MTHETKITTIVALIVAINEALMAFGITNFENLTAETIYAIVSTVAMFITWAISHYRNQNFTPEGIMGTIHTRELKAQKKEANYNLGEETEPEEIVIEPEEETEA